MITAIQGADQRGNHGHMSGHSPHWLRASSELGAKTGSKEPIEDREKLRQSSCGSGLLLWRNGPLGSRQAQGGRTRLTVGQETEGEAG